MNVIERCAKPLFYILMTALVVVCVVRSSSGGVDLPTYLWPAHEILNGNMDFYASTNARFQSYLGSVFVSLLGVPLMLCGFKAAVMIFAIVNALLFPVTWWLSEKVIRQIHPHFTLSWTSRLLTLAMLLDPVSMNAVQTNWTVVLLCLTTLSLYLSLRSRNASAGLAAGLAAAMKITSAVPVIFFLGRRNVKALLATGAVFAALSFLLPIAIFGKDVGYQLIGDWIHMIQKTAHVMYCKYNNQSPDCVMRRLLGWDSPDAPVFVWTIRMLGIAAFAYFSIRAHALGLVIAMVFVHLTFSPMVHDHYYAALLIPYLAINSLFVSGKLGAPAGLLWVFRCLYVHGIVLTTVGREVMESFLWAGQLLWGLVPLLLLAVVYRRDLASTRGPSLA